MTAPSTNPVDDSSRPDLSAKQLARNRTYLVGRLVALAMLGMSHDEPDPSVTELQKVLGHLIPACH